MSEPTLDYDEFDDVDRSNHPWVLSKKAAAAMFKLAREYHCSFDQNPGGAEFNSGLGSPLCFRCQIGDGDDVENLYLLRRTIWKMTQTTEVPR